MSSSSRLARASTGGGLLALLALACSPSSSSPSFASGGGKDATVALSFHGEDGPFPGFSFDTGAQPPASPVTVDLQLSVGGALTADAQAAAGGSGATPTVAGIPGTGTYALDVHFKVSGTLHAALPGVASYDGPIPGIENVDIAFSGTTTFDPFLIGGDAPVTANIPQTALPQIPLPGGIPGDLVITILAGSTMTSTFRGVCAGVVGTEVSYTAQTTSSANLLLQASVVIHTPLGDKSTDVPSFTVMVPATVQPLDMGTAMATTGGPAPTGTSVAQAGPCAPVPDGGTIGDGGSGGPTGSLGDGGDAGMEMTGDAGGGGDAGGTAGGTCGDPYEPNDDPSTAYSLPDVQDSDPVLTLAPPPSIGDDGADADWYTFAGIDGTNLTFTAQPKAMVIADDMTDVLEVCIWAEEDDNSTITAGCQAGTADTGTIILGDGTPVVGCCSTSGVAQIGNYGRLATNDDSLVIMRVRHPATATSCIGYSLAYSFGQ